jgi:hypothetical protein
MNKGLNELLETSKYVSVSSTLGEYYLVSAQLESENSILSRLLLTRVKEATPNQAELLDASTLDVSFGIYTHIAMSESNGLFLMVSQTDYDAATPDAVVTAGVVSVGTSQISVGPHTQFSSYNYSFTPGISRLDDQVFLKFLFIYL